MNGRMSKKIRKYVAKNDVGLLLTIQSIYGDKTKGMDARQIFRRAKGLYKGKHPFCRSWGKIDENNIEEERKKMNERKK